MIGRKLPLVTPIVPALMLVLLVLLGCQPTPRRAARGPEAVSTTAAPPAPPDAGPLLVADADADADGGAVSACSTRLELLPSEQGMEHERFFAIHDPGQDSDGEVGVARAALDVNADSVPDLVLELVDTGGNDGTILWTFYVACGATGTYRPVWGPDYLESFTLASTCTTVDSICWRDVRVVRSRAHVRPHVLHYDGASYR